MKDEVSVVGWLDSMRTRGSLRKNQIFQGMKLGVIVLDTCDDPLYTSERSLDLLQGFMYRRVKNIHKDVVCSNDTVKNILGIIGAQTSEVTCIFLYFDSINNKSKLC